MHVIILYTIWYVVLNLSQYLYNYMKYKKWSVIENREGIIIYIITLLFELSSIIFQKRKR